MASERRYTASHLDTPGLQTSPHLHTLRHEYPWEVPRRLLSRGYPSRWVCLGQPFSPFASAKLSQSSYLRDLQIDMSTPARFADESDNFALT
jgi:hypothetical protein